MDAAADSSASSAQTTQGAASAPPSNIHTLTTRVESHQTPPSASEAPQTIPVVVDDASSEPQSQDPSPVPPAPCPHRKIVRDGFSGLAVFPGDVDVPTAQPSIEGEAGEAARCQLCKEEIPAVAKMISQNRHLLSLLQQTRHHLSTHLAQCEPASASLTARAADLERQCRDRTEELKATQRDLQIMGEKLIDEIEKASFRAELQHSKESVQDELEQLTTQLFEEANGLVAAEKRQRAIAERQHRHLEDELRSTRNRLELETAQLEELRRRMEGLEADNIRMREDAEKAMNRERGREVEERDRREREEVDGGLVRNLSAVGIDGKSSTGLEDFAKDVTGGAKNSRASSEANPSAPSRSEDAGYASDDDGEGNPDDWIDPMAIAAFADFLSALPSIRFVKVASLAFMRVAFEDDIEPCLRFGGAPKVSVRRIADAFVANTLFVQETPAGAVGPVESSAPQAPVTPGDATPLSSGIASGANSPAKPVQVKSVWERLAGLPSVGPPDMCQACGAINPRGQPCRFQFRISDVDPWSALCLRCRDRMVAVGDFYNFIRHVHQGLYSRRPIVETFKDQARLRRNMFYARMGALELGLQDKNFGRMKSAPKHEERRDRGKSSTASSAPRSPAVGPSQSSASDSKTVVGSLGLIAAQLQSTGGGGGGLAHSPLWLKKQLGP
ncbi:hypothetical protein HDU93_007551 [Gonapodya sp. JEL0774]|nr:hypothetical protein HDU93_007551 [Gonapodya sp. JEL0774]